MKIQITLTDPDAFYESIRDAATGSLSDTEGLSASEEESLLEYRQKTIGTACSRWIKYGEYVTIEIDTDAGTATVKEAR